MWEFSQQLDRQERRCLSRAVGTPYDDPDRPDVNPFSRPATPYHSAVVYFTDRVSQLWEQSRTLFFPEICCVCLRPADVELSAYKQSFWFGLSSNESILNGIPHCADHGRDGRAKLACWYERQSKSVEYVLLEGLNQTFLNKVEAMNRVGECIPPWIYLPGGAPAQMWWRSDSWPHKAWWPFWDSLEMQERENYLRKWSAPTVWTEYFAYIDEYRTQTSK
jgi:hypothetical protein